MDITYLVIKEIYGTVYWYVNVIIEVQPTYSWAKLSGGTLTSNQFVQPQHRAITGQLPNVSLGHMFTSLDFSD